MKQEIGGMRIAFIGGGHMASAMIAGLRATGVAGADITVADPVAAQLTRLEREHGVGTTSDNSVAAAAADLIVLAVKPQELAKVATNLAALDASRGPRRRLYVSIAAGVRAADLARWLAPATPIVRAMPNRPATIGRGITALYAHAGVTAAERDAATRVLATCGATVWVESESLLDAVTAVSGSGPAYFFLLIEALEAAAIEQGLPAETARRLAIATADGAGRLAASSEDSPAVLRAQVTSKGGTTAAALDVFESGGLRAMVSRAVAAATRRSAELAEDANQQ
jgi:pyrroline-5-carboxylate reductase